MTNISRSKIRQVALSYLYTYLTHGSQPVDSAVFWSIAQEKEVDNLRMARAKALLHTARAMAPDISLTCLEGHMNFSIVEHALEYGCKKVQFCKGLTTQAMLDKAKANGLICNLFWADDPEEAKQYFDLGIDCILTNNYLPVSEALKK